MKEMNALKCENCGSSDIDILSDNYAVCKQCGTKFRFKNEKSAQIIRNEIYVHSDDDDAPINYIVVKKDTDEEDFRRKLLIKLAKTSGTPIDIFTSEFKPIRQEYYNFIAIAGDVTLSYSASVGFDRKEKYYETNSQGRSVERTRTVTDWKPVSGIYKGSSVGVAMNDGNSFDTLLKIRSALKNVPEKDLYDESSVDFETEFPKTPEDSAIAEAERDCVSNAKDACKWQAKTGDRIDKFMADGTVDRITEINSYIAPVYRTEYVYKGDTYKVEKLAFGGNSGLGLWSDLKCPSVSDNLDEQIYSKNFKFTLISVLICVVSSIISLLIDSLFVTLPIFLAAVSAYAAKVIHFRKTENKIYSDHHDAKIGKLNEYMRTHNMKEVTREEELEV